MNISNAELSALRCLLTKQDKASIAKDTNKSERTVEAVINSFRVNDEIENAIVVYAKNKIAVLNNIIDKISAKNSSTELITAENFIKAKEAASWTFGRTYYIYIDTYLALSSINFADIGEVYDYLSTIKSPLLAHPFYLSDLLARLLGVDIETVLKFVKSK